MENPKNNSLEKKGEAGQTRLTREKKGKSREGAETGARSTGRGNQKGATY